MCVFAAPAMVAMGVSAEMAAAAAVMANISLAGSLLSTGMAAYGQYQQVKAQKQQLQYQASIDASNAKVAEWQAQDALERGRTEELMHRMKVSSLIGTQTATFAAAGIDPSSGSALDIIGDTAEFGELDARIIRSNAEREAYGYRVKSSNFAASSNLNRAGAGALSPGLTAGTTLVAGAGSFADKWYNIQMRTG